MPKPKKGETEKEFISRCMGYDDMQKYDQKQRAAICFSYWERKDETIDMDSFTNILLDEEEKKIKRGDVYKAARDAAEDIHGEVDNKILNSIVSNAIEKGKDTEDAIQIAINMMRSKK